MKEYRKRFRYNVIPTTPDVSVIPKQDSVIPKTDALQSKSSPIKEESHTKLPVESKAERLARARAILGNPVIPKIEDVKLRPELYRAGKRYAPGTEVRDIKGTVFIAPELDAGGQPIHEEW